jgi:hypothetical protein
LRVLAKHFVNLFLLEKPTRSENAAWTCSMVMHHEHTRRDIDMHGQAAWICRYTSKATWARNMDMEHGHMYSMAMQN